MNCYDIVYIQGNPNSGTFFQHNQINGIILKLIEKYDYTLMQSEHKNLSDFIHPKAKIYIGFSRGSRYLKKLPNESLKISIGGVKSTKVHRFTHRDDKILQGDISEESMNAHFMIEDVAKIQISALIEQFLYYNIK